MTARGARPRFTARREGDDALTAVLVPVACHRCGRAVRSLPARPAALPASRQRRLVVECTRPACAWAGLLVVELVDLARAGAALAHPKGA